VAWCEGNLYTKRGHGPSAEKLVHDQGPRKRARQPEMWTDGEGGYEKKARRKGRVVIHTWGRGQLWLDFEPSSNKKKRCDGHRTKSLRATL